MTEHQSKPNVELNVMQRKDRSMYYELNVYGVAFPRSSMQGILEVGKETNEEKTIMLLAGALAEALIERVHDTMLDPDKVAHTAQHCYQELHAENPHIQLGNELPRYADKHITEGRVGLN